MLLALVALLPTFTSGSGAMWGRRDVGEGRVVLGVNQGVH